MYRQIELNPPRTYANRENAERAVKRALGEPFSSLVKFSVTYLYTAEGRCFPMILNADPNQFSEIVQISLQTGFLLVN
jgi:hypothetical protein